MPKHRITFEFETTVGEKATSGGRSGWTESWYDPKELPDEECLNNAGSLAFWRRTLLTSGWSLTACRCSQLDASNNLIRRGVLEFYTPATAVGTYVSSGQDEQPYDALEVRVNTANGRRRPFPMRGIPANIINAGARYLPTASWLPRFIYWGKIVAGTAGGFPGLIGPFALRVRTLVAGGQALTGNRPIKAVLLASDPAWTLVGSPQTPLVTTELGANLVAGQQIQIQRADGLRNFNGTWLIAQTETVAGNTGLLLSPKRRTTVQGTYTAGSGFLRAYGFTLDNVSSVFGEYGTSRRTGRPTQLPRGRRSNRQS